MQFLEGKKKTQRNISFPFLVSPAWDAQKGIWQVAKLSYPSFTLGTDLSASYHSNGVQEKEREMGMSELPKGNFPRLQNTFQGQDELSVVTDVYTSTLLDIRISP